MTATDQNWRTLDAVEAVAKRRESTPAAVALAWLLARPEVSTVIIAPAPSSNSRTTCARSSVKLSGEDVKQLDEASQPAWGYPYGFIGTREPW